MADTQDASIGWGGALRIANGSGVLTEIQKVTGLKPPSNRRARVEVTHLKSPDQRPEYINGLFEDSEVTATVFHRPGSDTANLLFDASAANTSRAVEIDIPLAGEAVETYSFNAYVSYEVDNIEAGTAMTAAISLSITGAVTKADAA